MVCRSGWLVVDGASECDTMQKCRFGNVNNKSTNLQKWPTHKGPKRLKRLKKKNCANKQISLTLIPINPV